MENLIISVTVAIVYFYYHWQSFQYAEEALNIRKARRLYIQITFLVNYALFILMSYLKIHLCINWTCFLIILFIENLMIFKCSVGCAYSLALTGTSVGLAINVFLRCVFAIVLNKPLVIFDNNIKMYDNLKRYPVFFGFLVAGIVFQTIRTKKLTAKIRIIMEESESLRFLGIVQSILYIYLILNLLGYYTKGNSFPMKMWGIKSALFSMLGLLLLIIYLIHMNKLRIYQEKVKVKREELLATKKDEEKIWLIAFTDTLTGCYNRQYAQEMFDQLEETGIEAVLCFIDLDGLKIVNDNYGHQKGDSYLLTAVECMEKVVRKDQDYIFRYGGDEFLLLFKEITPEIVDTRMKKVQKQMQGLSYTSELPFSLSISYGIASRSESKNLKETVILADERMYEQKQKKRTRDRSMI